MAAIQNEIDQLFLATLEQSEPGGGDSTRAVMLNSSSPAGFKRNATGVLTPTAIVFDAVPLNMAGAVVTWTTDGVALTVNGNTATLPANAMGVASTGAVVKCTLDFENVRYERTSVVQVVADGKNGDSTELTAAEIKAALEGQITETELFGDLRTRIGLIDAGAGVTGSVAARVKTETDARVAALTQEAADRATYVKGYTYSKAETNESLSIQADTITAAYTAYADEARRLAGVASSADIRNYAYSKASADEALTALATTLRSEFSTNNGATVAYVQNYTYSKANTDSAISSLATTLRAEFSNSAGVTAAYVQNYTYSKAEANGAIASQTQDLRTTVGNNTTAISTQAESVNGLRAQYTVKIDNNGYVTGYGLASSYANGVPTSSFIINADRFAVVSPGVAPRVMFSVGKVNGQNAVGLNGNVFIDGSIEVRKADGTLLVGAGGVTDAALPAGTKNSEIVVGGRNLCPDGDFERGFHQLRGAAGLASVNVDASVGAVSGTKSLFMQGSAVDMYVYLGTRISVTPGREYRISFYSKSATSGVVTASSSYILLWNSAGTPVVHTPLPMDNLGVGSWKRQVVAWTCPPDITQIEPRFGITTNGVYSWLAIDCVQIEEGNTVTQWAPATEDIAADAQAKADASRTAAQVYATEQINLANVTTRAYADGKVTAEEQRAIADATAKANAARDAAIADANAKLAAKMNRGNDVLGGVIAVDAVNAPAGFRAGPLSWNAAGDYTSGYGTALTPKGLIAYNQAGQRTFMVNGQTGDVSIRGEINGGAFTGYAWPAAGGVGFHVGPNGALFGNKNDGRWLALGTNGFIESLNFNVDSNGQVTVNRPIIIAPQLRTDFYVTVANLYLNSQVNTSSYQSFPVSVAKVNGLAPYRYNWAFQAEEGDILMGADPTNENGIVRARGTNRICSGFMTCTVTDANGATHSDSGYIRIQFGSGVPV